MFVMSHPLSDHHSHLSEILGSDWSAGRTDLLDRGPGAREVRGLLGPESVHLEILYIGFEKTQLKDEWENNGPRYQLSEGPVFVLVLVWAHVPVSLWLLSVNLIVLIWNDSEPEDSSLVWFILISNLLRHEKHEKLNWVLFSPGKPVVWALEHLDHWLGLSLTLSKTRTLTITPGDWIHIFGSSIEPELTRFQNMQSSQFVTPSTRIVPERPGVARGL